MSDAKPLSSLETDIGLRQQQFSEKVASDILRLFTISVVSTLALTIALASVDALFIYKKVITPSDRLITGKVIMSIIAASIVQVGASAIAIVYALFKTPRSSLSDDK